MSGNTNHLARNPVQSLCQKYVRDGTENEPGWVKKGVYRVVNRDPIENPIDWMGLYRLFQSKLQDLVSNPWLDFIITISIILNTGFLATEHHGMSPDVKQVLDVGNKVSCVCVCVRGVSISSKRLINDTPNCRNQ